MPVSAVCASVRRASPVGRSAVILRLRRRGIELLPGLVATYIAVAEPSLVPVPASLPLLGLGLAALLGLRRFAQTAGRP